MGEDLFEFDPERDWRLGIHFKESNRCPLSSSIAGERGGGDTTSSSSRSQSKEKVRKNSKKLVPSFLRKTNKEGRSMSHGAPSSIIPPHPPNVGSSNEDLDGDKKLGKF